MDVFGVSMFKSFRSTLPLLISLSLAGCGDDGMVQFDEDALQCGTTDANEQLFDYMQEWYFWDDQLPDSFDGSSQPDMYETLDFLRVAQDRFSFMMTAEEYDDYQASIFFGYGFSHQSTEDSDGLLIRYVFDEGSAAQNGLRRGDVITEVNGVTVQSILADVANGTTTLSDVFGPNEDGYTIDIKFRKPDGSIVTTQFSKGSISANTVMAEQVKTITVNEQEQKVGYLVFDSFDNKSEQELNEAFDQFAAEDIDQMVLDLRYNSGGLIRVAKQLSTQIAGDAVEGEVFVQYVHNEQQSGQNTTSYFSLGAGIEKLNLDKVVVLTSAYSCSASELVINALTPFIEVVTIGGQTCGKPVGMYPTEICDHVVFAINFQTQNAAGFGDYFDGLEVDCNIEETITGDWGVETDPMLAEGLHYLVNGQCSDMSANSVKHRGKANAPKLDYRQSPYQLKNML
jgi:C-terminal processing protease CtpA/Prc